MLPQKIKNEETDDFIAWKLGRKVIKASKFFLQAEACGCHGRHVRPFKLALAFEALKM